jgi:hypothetical protein
MRSSEVAALQEDKRTLQRSVADLSATAVEKDRLVAELRKRMEEVQKKAADVPLPPLCRDPVDPRRVPTGAPPRRTFTTARPFAHAACAL